MVEAAGRGDLDEVRRLLQQDRQLLNADYHGATPLKAAASEGRLEVLRYLLDEGAEINHMAGGITTALELACSIGRWEVVVLLLARGADTSPSDDGGWTPLMSASCQGHADACNILLAHGCGDVDHQEYHGRTALNYASAYGRVGVVRVLLGAGADLLLVDQGGHTPLSLAIRGGHAECVALLQVGQSHAFMPRIAHVCAPFHHASDGPAPLTTSLRLMHRSGSAATSSPRPAASAMPLPHCATARQATPRRSP
jgi:serine/threonine-protein phosphatase 6 regulatory ankyrin repeat subunit B